MKKLLLLILLFIPFILKGQIKTDNYYHAGAGAILSTGMYAIGQYSERDMNPTAPALMAITAGFSKEMFDSFNTGNFSKRDFLVTSVSGIVVNVVLHVVWKKKHHKRKKDIEFNDLPLVIIKK